MSRFINAVMTDSEAGMVADHLHHKIAEMAERSDLVSHDLITGLNSIYLALTGREHPDVNDIFDNEDEN